MDSKLKNMYTKKYLFCFFLLFTISCKTTVINDNNQNYFINNYKGVFFKNCLKNGFSNSEEIKVLLEKDKSYNSDFLLGLNNYKKIDSISKSIYFKIQEDSIKSLDMAEGNAGSKVFKYCLCAFNSKELDSIAKKAYQNQNNFKN